MVPRVVQQDHLFEVGLRLVALSEPEECLPQYIMGLHEEGRISRILSTREDELRELSRGVKFSADGVILPEPAQYGKQLLDLAHLFAQFACARINLGDLRCAVAFDGDQCHSETDLKRKLLPGAFRC